MRPSKQGCRAVAVAALISITLSGCNTVWDDITRRDRSVGANFKSLFTKPDPMKVLADSNDGDDRACALSRLDEPLQRKNGTQKEQDLVVEILTKTATADPQPVCRLVAIEKLGHFKDPRAGEALKAAFYEVDTNISKEFANLKPRIQCTALTAMGNCGNPDNVPLLAQVLKEPKPERSDELRNRNDRCMAAARALAHYNQAEATEALYHIMENRKEDIALRDCAWGSLRTSTGKKLPNEPEQWDDFLHPKDGKALAQQQGGWLNNIKLATWFQREPAPNPAPPLTASLPVPPATRPGVLPPAGFQPSSAVLPPAVPGVPTPGAAPAPPGALSPPAANPAQTVGPR